MTEIRPLGNRVLIKPNPKRTESASGLAIVEDWQPDTSGVVVAVGDGVESRKKAVQRFANTVIEAISAIYYQSTTPNSTDEGRVRKAIRDLQDNYQPEHVCKVGDEVTFGVTAGTELDLGGELYLLVNEDDLETICEPIEAV